VLSIDGRRGLAISLDGPPAGERDPFAAGWSAVMGAALNVACAGGEPLALTDCLNFGNPERPEIAWELARAIDGIAAAAGELGVPVVSGNVSLYNETGGRPIPPTPVVGCVGLVHDLAASPGCWHRGDRVVFLPGAGAALIHFVWTHAARFTLCHDLTAGALTRAVAEASAWSGVEPTFAHAAVGGASPEAGVLVALPGHDLEPLGWHGAVELGHV
jgi:phosphoribosylformylglycinamidine synthase